MADDPDEVIYGARKPGWPGFVAIMHADPKWAKETAKDMAAWIRSGYTVERCTRHEASDGILEFWNEQKRRDAEKAAAEPPAPETLPLFETPRVE